ARSPVEETDAEFPRRLSLAMEFTGFDAQPSVEIIGKRERGGFADADDTHLLGAHDADVESGDLDLEGNGREEAGAAAAKNEDALDCHFPPRRGRVKWKPLRATRIIGAFWRGRLDLGTRKRKEASAAGSPLLISFAESYPFASLPAPTSSAG